MSAVVSACCGPRSGRGLLVALYLSRFPIVKHGGKWMFASVAVFGVCTLTFGLSTSVWLSGVVLFLGGAADMISVNIRQTLIQLATPDHMRGRVSSVSMLFIGASNELGEAYSGVAVRFLGHGRRCRRHRRLTATGLWARWFPDLGRRIGWSRSWLGLGGWGWSGDVAAGFPK
jgi:hypothetical protein